MGLFFTLLFIMTAYISPQVLLGNGAAYHVEVYIALVALACSLWSAPGTGILKQPQTFAYFGLVVAVPMSFVQRRMFGMIPMSMFDFVPNATVFFFVALNCKKKIHLQLLVAVLFGTALYNVSYGLIAAQSADATSPYVVRQFLDQYYHNNAIYRIRAQSFLNDPNDLAQFLAAMIPLMFFFWEKGKTLKNLMLSYLPGLFLLVGMFNTHSRGGMMAVVATAIVAGRRKIGIWKSAVLGGFLLGALSVLGWSGGREVSAANGEDRMGAWSMGLEILRNHLPFGCGYRRYTDFYAITAHNTAMVCAAELGLFGFFWWMMFILPPLRDVAVAARLPKPIDEDTAEEARKLPALPRKREAPVPERRPQMAFSQAALAMPGGSRMTLPSTLIGGTNGSASSAVPSAEKEATVARYAPNRFSTQDDKLTEQEFRRLCNVLVLSFTGFLTAGWFLSRAYTMTLFILTGMATAVIRMGRDAGYMPTSLSFRKAASLSIKACAILIGVVYLILRVDHIGK